MIAYHAVIPSHLQAIPVECLQDRSLYSWCSSMSTVLSTLLQGVALIVKNIAVHFIGALMAGVSALRHIIRHHLPDGLITSDVN